MSRRRTTQGSDRRVRIHVVKEYELRGDTFSILNLFPLSVSSASYLSASGPTKSWYDEGAATM